MKGLSTVGLLLALTCLLFEAGEAGMGVRVVGETYVDGRYYPGYGYFKQGYFFRHHPGDQYNHTYQRPYFYYREGNVHRYTHQPYQDMYGKYGYGGAVRVDPGQHLYINTERMRHLRYREDNLHYFRHHGGHHRHQR